MKAIQLILLAQAFKALKEEIAKEALVNPQLRILAQRLHDVQQETELQAAMATEYQEKDKQLCLSNNRNS